MMLYEENDSKRLCVGILRLRIPFRTAPALEMTSSPLYAFIKALINLHIL